MDENNTGGNGSSWADNVPWDSISDTLTGLFDSLWGDNPQQYPQQPPPQDNTSKYVLYAVLALAAIMVIFMLKK